MRKWSWAPVAAALALAVAGCGGGAPEAEPAQETAAAAPESPPGVALTDARVQLPAVSGRPGVAYFTVAQTGGAPRAIAAVAVAMAGRTEMHETVRQGAKSTMKPLGEVPLAPGETVAFAPGGRHVMLFDLNPKLRFQEQTELTVTFADGDKASVPAKVTTVNELADHAAEPAR